MIQSTQQPHSLLWQHPYVHLWKACSVGQWPKGKSARQGEVTSCVVSCQMAQCIMTLLMHQATKAHQPHSLQILTLPHVCHGRRCACPQDRSIGRVIWRISGNVPAANFIRLPQLHNSSLGLTGRILYLQVENRTVCLSLQCELDVSAQATWMFMQCDILLDKVGASRHAFCSPLWYEYAIPAQVQLQPAEHFAIHIEVTTQEGNPCRLSISSLYEATAVQVAPRPHVQALPSPAVILCAVLASGLCKQHAHAHEHLRPTAAAERQPQQRLPGSPMQPQMAPGGLSVQLAHRAHTSAWTLLGVNVAAALAAQHISYRCIRSLQLCGAMSVRGAFTSDIVYRPQVICAASRPGW